MRLRFEWMNRWWSFIAESRDGAGMIKKIISGGQTGVDRAALDLAMELNIPCGGWCPQGRLAEDGIIPEKYPLQETVTAEYEERTRKNVEDSDGTLILTHGQPKGGTTYTIEITLILEKPVWIIDFNSEFSIEAVAQWIDRNFIFNLNIAGPRESVFPGIYEQAKEFLREIFEKLIH